MFGTKLILLATFWRRPVVNIRRQAAQRFRSAVPRRTAANRGVAQMVARHVRDVEAVGSSPATPTKSKKGKRIAGIGLI